MFARGGLELGSAFLLCTERGVLRGTGCLYAKGESFWGSDSSQELGTSLIHLGSNPHTLSAKLHDPSPLTF
mgnify:CR=1 FL=1